MLSLTAKHFVMDMPDGFHGAVVHPPTWVVSLESNVDGSGTLAYLDRDRSVSVRCTDTDRLGELLDALGDFQAGPDTAVHRSYYQYDFSFARFGMGRWDRRSIRLCLNSCADRGREPEALLAVLGWLAEQVQVTDLDSDASGQFAVWAPPRPY